MKIRIFEMSKEAYLRLTDTYGPRIFLGVVENSEGTYDVALNENVIIKISDYIYIDLGDTIELIKRDEFNSLEVF